MGLEKYKGQLLGLCVSCGNCGLGFLKPFSEENVIPKESGRALCPPYLRYKFQSYRPSGRMAIIASLALGKLELCEDFAKNAYSCTLGGSCEEVCIGRVPVFRALREHLVEAGFGPLEASKKIDRNIEKTSNPFGGKKEKRSAWSKGLDLPKRGEFLYFAGCFNSYLYPEVSRATVGLMRKAGIDVAYLGDDEVCCGNHPFLDGQTKKGQKQASLVLNAIEKSGAKTVVTSCSSGYRAFKNDYVESFGKLPFDVFHITEYLAKLIKDGKITFTKEIAKKVSYHDPCSLTHHGSRVFEAPREIIKAISGVEYVELKNNRAWSRCCGGGMSVNYFATPDLATWSAQQRLGEIIEAGSEILVTSCPHGKANFRRAAKQAGLSIEVMDLTELAGNAISA